MPDVHTLYAPFDIRGQWHLPKCDHAVSGLIHYDNGEKYLETEGQIEKDQSFFDAMTNFDCTKLIPIIHGLLVTGEKVTITNSRLINNSRNFTGTPICKYIVGDLFIGESYDSINDIVFEKLDVDYSNLKYWYNVTGINVKHTKEFFSAIATTPKTTVTKLNEHISIKIITQSRFQNEIEEQRVTISESPSWVFESKSQLSYKEFCDYANCYRHFLMLGMGVGVYFVSLMGTIGDTKVIILPNTTIPQKLLKRNPELMLFRYNTIKKNFSEHIQTWYIIWKKFSDPIMNYFTMIDRPNNYMLYSLFLTTAVCLESFHEYRFPTPRSQKKDPKLNIRLKKLLLHCPDAFENVEKEQKTFISEVIRTRNYLAHGFPKLKIKAVTENNDLIYLLQQMQILIEGCFLKELPFDDSILKEIMQMNRQEKNNARNDDECSKHSANTKTKN